MFERHEPLRTRYPDAGADDVLFAEVQQAGAVAPLLVAETAAPGPPDLDGYLLAEWTRTFDIIRGPLVAARLIRFERDRHLLILTLHHLVCDGTSSLGILARDLFRSYALLAAGPTELFGPEPPLAFHYGAFAISHREWLEGGVRAEIEDYWRGQLPAAGPEPVLVLPTDGRADGATGRAAVQDVAFADDGGDLLRQACRRFRTTPFVLFLTSILVAVRELGGAETVGAVFPVSVRAAFQAHDQIGRFSDTSAVHLRIEAAMRYREIVLQVRERVLSAQMAAGLPFGEVVRALYPEAYERISYPPCLFVTNDRAELPEFGMPGLSGSPCFAPLAGKQSIHPGLSVRLTEKAGAMRAAIHYPAGAYTPEVIGDLAARISSALTRVLTDAEAELGAVEELGR